MQIYVTINKIINQPSRDRFIHAMKYPVLPPSGRQSIFSYTMSATARLDSSWDVDIRAVTQISGPTMSAAQETVTTWWPNTKEFSLKSRKATTAKKAMYWIQACFTCTDTSGVYRTACDGTRSITDALKLRGVVLTCAKALVVRNLKVTEEQGAIECQSVRSVRMLLTIAGIALLHYSRYRHAFRGETASGTTPGTATVQYEQRVLIVWHTIPGGSCTIRLRSDVNW